MSVGALYGKARPENFPEVNDHRNPAIPVTILVSDQVKVAKFLNG